MLSVLLTEAQWADYPANYITDVQGQPAITPRYTPPAFVEVNDTMSSVALYLAKQSNDQLVE
jgi:hypothetical protein